MSRFEKLHCDFDYDDLNTTNSDHFGRRYVTPEGNKYPSMTSICGVLNEGAINEWRERVGEKEANRVSHHAATRGTFVHESMERYVETGEMEKVSSLYKSSYRKLTKILDERLQGYYVQEKALYSNYLKAAGRTDLVGRFDNLKSIIDFKTSGKPKERKWISHYFIQLCGYSIMFEERTGIPMPNLVIIMDIDGHDPVVFKEKRDDWVKPLMETIDLYRKKKEWKNQE